MAIKQPTAVHELKGSYKKNPQRKPKGEPVPTESLGNPPIHFSPIEARCWHEIEEIIPPGVAFNSDRLALEQMASLVARSRTDGLSAADLGVLVRLMASFGMTPVDRARISVAPQEKKNPFASVG